MGADSAVVTKPVAMSVEAATKRLIELAEARGLKIFAVIDQAAEADAAGLSLRPTTLVLLGSPSAGTPVMSAVPLVALDLPLKALIWSECGETQVSYLSPNELDRRYSIPAELRGRFSGLEALADALAAASDPGDG